MSKGKKEERTNYRIVMVEGGGRVSFLVVVVVCGDGMDDAALALPDINQGRSRGCNFASIKNLPAAFVEGAGTGRKGESKPKFMSARSLSLAGDFLRDLRDLWVEAYMKKE